MEMICDMCEEDLDQNRLPNILPNTVQPLVGLQVRTFRSTYKFLKYLKFYFKFRMFKDASEQN